MILLSARSFARFTYRMARDAGYAFVPAFMGAVLVWHDARRRFPHGVPLDLTTGQIAVFPADGNGDPRDAASVPTLTFYDDDEEVDDELERVDRSLGVFGQGTNGHP